MEETPDIDLNQDLRNLRASILGSVANSIERRVQRLEAITSTARQRQWHRRQRQNDPQPLNQDTINSEGSIASEEVTAGHSRSSKRGGSHLVAEALGMDTDVTKVEGSGGGFYDCHICLDMAREPILTCCGHLFCWSCFYRLPYVQSNVKECPVCRGEVAEKSITPIYGSNYQPCKSEAEEYGVEIPPRPQAHRVESVGQRRRVGRRRQPQSDTGFSTFQIEEALLPRIVPGSNNFEAAQIPPDAESSSSTRRPSLLRQEASSVPFPNPLAVSSVESMVDNLETFYYSYASTRRNIAEGSLDYVSDLFTNATAAILHLENEFLGTAAGTNSTVPHSSASSRTTSERMLEHVDASFVGLPPMIRRSDTPESLIDNRNSLTMAATAATSLEEDTLSTYGQMNSTLPLSSSSSRSTDVPFTNLHVENETTDASATVPAFGNQLFYLSDVVGRESRRRRLR